MKLTKGSPVILLIFLLSICPLPPLAAVASPRSGSGAPGWMLSTSNANSNYAPTFLGNGYMGARIPAQGMGYSLQPFPNTTEVVGFYDHAGNRASLPTWSTLAFSDGASTYGFALPPGPEGTCQNAPRFPFVEISCQNTGTRSSPGKVLAYQQTLDLLHGLLTTSATWVSTTGNTTDLVYQVLVDQARPHIAAVRLTFTPHWSGWGSATDLLDGASAAKTTGAGHSFSQSEASIEETVQANGTSNRASLASRLDVSGVPATTVNQLPAQANQTSGQVARFPVVAERTYTVTKYIGVTTSHEDGNPQNAARLYAALAGHLGYQKLLAEHARAWKRLWQSNVKITGDPQLQLEVRASLFYLLESARAGVNWSIAPGGLSTDAYNGHIFWDAETWMYPPLLLTHPEIARTINTYRQERLRAAQQNARELREQGAKIGWESALTGYDVAPFPENPLEVHVNSDVILAQWQYYLATGDKDWLAQHGWPLISQIARFWVSRVTSDPAGGYAINHVQGPDEYHYPVNNSVYTNATAAASLRIAAQVAQTLGLPADPQWTKVADGLHVSVDRRLNIHPEFAGYDGSTVKQADVVLLQYPWEYPMSTQLERSDLQYYAPRTDVRGPSMSDAIYSIASCSLNDPEAAYTYLQKSIRPFMHAPFNQMSENQIGSGAFTFITGIGGFLQAFYYGFTGLRWRSNRVHLDPCLPSQMQGITLTGLSWQGRTFNLSITHQQATLTLLSGPAMPVEVGTRQPQMVPARGTLILPVR